MKRRGRRIERAEVKFLGSFAGYALYYRKTNEEIREELGIYICCKS
jgi:hypothetical protein